MPPTRSEVVLADHPQRRRPPAAPDLDGSSFGRRGHRCEHGVVAPITTRPGDGDVDAYLDAVPDQRRRADAQALRTLMEKTTGAVATMWGPSIVGFGSRPHANASGSTEWFVVGFSARTRALTIYGLVDGDTTADPLFDELGAHTTGKGCLYIKRLADVDLATLAHLIATRWAARHAP
jgi:hypothetical protein